MHWWWAAAGALIGGDWLRRLISASIGMRHVADITQPEWDLKPTTTEAPSLLVVVPARDEAAQVRACLESLLLQDYPKLKICALDDRSSDSTGAIMDELAGQHPERLKVNHIRELPPDWLGKTHAMWLGAQQDDSDWILFTDGDILFRSDAVRRAMAYASEVGCDHLVLFPTMLMRSFGERMMLSFFQLLFSLVHRPYKVQDPRARDAIGVGAFNLIRRSAYLQLGTYRALRMEVLDDMKLGAAVKEHGLKQRVVFGPNLLRLRWAEGAIGVVRNLRKNMFSAVRFSWTLSALVTIAIVLFHVLPWVAIFIAPGWTKLGFAVALLCVASMYLGMSLHSEVPFWFFFTHPVAALVMIYIGVFSAVSSVVNGGVVWRGTTYSLEQIHAVTSAAKLEQERRRQNLPSRS